SSPRRATMRATCGSARVVVPIGMPTCSGGHPVPSQRHTCAAPPAALDLVTAQSDLPFEQQARPDADAGAAGGNRPDVANSLRSDTAPNGETAPSTPALRARSEGAAFAIGRLRGREVCVDGH